MSHVALAALFAVFIWWFSTGLVLLLNGTQRHAYRWTLLASSTLGLTALWALAHTANQTSTAGVYCAFTSALLVWGWHELSFLTGWITGPRTTAIPATLAGWPRFVQAVGAILWHELGILAVGILIVAVTWGAPNQTGTWTFLVLWAMRTSAKLNLFLGVRNLSEEFLPPHLAYLESFFRRRAMNWFFPPSVAAASVVLAWMVMVALSPSTTSTEVLRLTLVGTLLAMAIVEHAMLVLPLSTTALWRWAMGARHKKPQAGDTALRPSQQLADDTAAGIASGKATGTVAATVAQAVLPTSHHKNAPRAEAAPLMDHDGKLLHAR
jgi:putative photosynthetic complex assembly protein 2